jgi:AcrR family transcriptional regulator
MNFAVAQTRAKLPSRQDERRRASDARMLRAAMAIIAQKGAAGASLAEIGVAAGFSRGLPAERFGTKLAMLNALMDFMEGWFAERLRKAVGDKTGLDAVRARRALFHICRIALRDTGIAAAHPCAERQLS